MEEILLAAILIVQILTWLFPVKQRQIKPGKKKLVDRVKERFK